jgi:hypothetical protein
MRKTLLTLAFLLCGAGPLFAQARPTTPPAPRPATPSPARPAEIPAIQVAPQPPAAPPIPMPAQPDAAQNIRIEVTITDSAASAKKVVSMMFADGRNGRVRSQGHGMLNVDGSGHITRDGKLQISVTFDYTPTVSSDRVVSLNEAVTVLVLDGKPTLISQSADPDSDRKVTVEVTATIVK